MSCPKGIYHVPKTFYYYLKKKNPLYLTNFHEFLSFYLIWFFHGTNPSLVTEMAFSIEHCFVRECMRILYLLENRVYRIV